MKQKRIGPIKKWIFNPQSHKKKKLKPAKIDRVKAEIQAHTYTHSPPPHTHTSIQSFLKNHVFWFLTPRNIIITCFYNNSKNYCYKASSTGKQNKICNTHAHWLITIIHLYTGLNNQFTRTIIVYYTPRE